MSVAKSVSVDMGTLMSVHFDDRMQGVESVEIADTVAIVGARRSSGNPSLAPNVGCANIGESFPGTHPPTAQGYTSLGNAASGMIPSMALGRYSDPDDIVQDRFWTNTVRRRRDVDSDSDLSIPEFDSRSEYDRYFAERDTRRESNAMVSASAQVTPHTWTPMVPDPSQLGPYLLSNIGTPPFKKPKTPPPRAVITTTEMYMRHTSQDVVATAQRGHRRSSSSSTSTGSRIPGPPQTSPRSSVQQWLDALDTQVPPPPTPVIPTSQPVSMYSGVTTSMPLGYCASQMAAQRVRSSRQSQTSRRSRLSNTSATVIQGMMDFSTQMSNNITHLADGIKVDAAHREDAMHHESLAREQCHRIQANEWDKIQRDEALESEKLLKQEALERDKMQKQEATEWRREAVLREERVRADALASDELRVRSQA